MILNAHRKGDGTDGRLLSEYDYECALCLCRHPDGRNMREIAWPAYSGSEDAPEWPGHFVVVRLCMGCVEAVVNASGKTLTKANDPASSATGR